MAALSTDTLLILSTVLAIGIFVETVAGFGGTLLALALGTRWFALEPMLAWFIPLNLLLSLILAIRGRAEVDRRALGRRILPLILPGLAVGTALAWVIVADAARVVFAGVVVAIALVELRAQLRPQPPTGPMRPAVERTYLVGAGLVHGLFGTGGPLAVAAISRAMPTKTAMRATLAVLWLTLNVLVLVRLVARDFLDLATLAGSAALIPALAAGLGLGELVHRRVSERAFRRATAGLLLVCGAVVLVSSL
jgi:uncharacterized membrane protein YfcA